MDTIADFADTAAPPVPDTPEDAAFREEVRAFCRTACPEWIRDVVRRGGKLGRKQWEPWQRILHARGWGAPDWPASHGGTGWTVRQRQIFGEVLAECDCPPPHHQGLRHIGPVLMRFGTPEQQARFLPPMVDGSSFWCQGYSEPGSGSDLASLRTAAVRDGDDYVVNGQKIWTTGAHEADWMYALVRTSTEAKKHGGITLLVFPMDSPGLTVRPIRTIDGWHHVNEVFFSDVRVPLANRVGEEGQAWEYGKYLLQHERLGVAASLSQLARTMDRTRDAIERELPGDAGASRRHALLERLLVEEAELVSLRELSGRCVAAMADGSPLGSLPSVLKLASTELAQRVSAVALDAAGQRLAAHFTPLEGEGPNAEDEGGEAVHAYLYLRSRTVVAGTTEVQKNLIARALFGS